MELDERLSDMGDGKLLARAIVNELYTLLVQKGWAVGKIRNCARVDNISPPSVLQLGGLMGKPVRMMFRKAESGVRVPFWILQVTG